MVNLQTYFELSSRNHNHLCPRQILGVRIGLAGAKALDLDTTPTDKRLLVIVESDGCFADGVIAATGRMVGHRTLRIEDYGKIAATFVDTTKNRALRVAPQVNVRERALTCVPDESRHYYAQLQAYQVLPEEELLTFTEVQLKASLAQILSNPNARTRCAICGEEIINEREIVREGCCLCRACAGQAYYTPASSIGTQSTFSMGELARG